MRCRFLPGMGLREAACLPETCFTVWSNMVLRGRAEGGRAVPCAWRLVRHRDDGDPDRRRLGRAGLRHRRDRTRNAPPAKGWGRSGRSTTANEDFVEILQAEGGANLILDMVGGPYLPRNVKALADDGRLVQIAFLQGPKVELNFAEVMMRRLTITGSTLRPQSDLAKARLSRRSWSGTSGR